MDANKFFIWRIVRFKEKIRNLTYINNKTIEELERDNDIRSVAFIRSLVGKIKDITFEDVNIDFKNSTNISAIALDIVHNGNISNTVVSGNIKGGGNVSGFVNMIIQHNISNKIEAVLMSKCINKANIESYSGKASGIISEIWQSSSEINEVANWGNIKSPNIAAGIIGEEWQNGIYDRKNYEFAVKNAYNSGKISGSIVSGIVGNSWQTQERSSYYNIYNSGELIGNNKYGFTYDMNKEAIKKNVYWNKNYSIDGIQNLSSSDINFKGLTEVEMKQKALYAGFDFEKIWIIDEGTSYPRLRAFE